MKDTLNFSFWPEPLVPVDMFNYKRPWLKKKCFLLLATIINKLNLLISSDKLVLAIKNERIEGTYWPLYAHTMIGKHRLSNIQTCVESIYRDGVKGDFIEAGVWRGGVTIFMKALIEVHNDITRKVFVADSFKGLPKPSYQQDSSCTYHLDPFLSISVDEVMDNFTKYNLLDDRIVFIEGYFSDTMPTAPIDKLSLLRLDCDMYESTYTVLENLYPKLSDGGYCIIDDWSLPYCKQAVRDYIFAHNINVNIFNIDPGSVYWCKE